MGRFSEYIEKMQLQTEKLREATSRVSMTDCSKMSIGNCADVIRQLEPDDYVPEIKGYVRPDWYPNIKNILINSPIIEKDGVTYHPAYAMIYDSTHISDVFKQKYSTSSDYAVTAGDAYLFSDVCDNDVINASAETLEVGTNITHIWNIEKDIKNNDNASQAVRWVVVYVINKNTAITPRIHQLPCIECVVGDCTLHANAFGFPSYSTSVYNFSILYYEELESTRHPTAQYFARNWNRLIEIVINSNMTTLDGLFRCYGLRKVVLNCPLQKITGDYSISSAHGMEYIELPETLTLLTGKYMFSDCTNLKAMVVPKNVTEIGEYFCNNCSKMVSISMSSNISTIGTYFCSKCSNLKTVVIPDSVTSIGGVCNDCYGLETFIFGTNITSVHATSFNSNYNLKKIVLPPNLTNYLSGSTSGARHQSLYQLEYLKIPNTVAAMGCNTDYMLEYLDYLELFDDFNITGQNFKGKKPKTIQWLKDLCKWLKDRTGETAGTMTIGPDNIANAQNIWLTFNPDNKKDIVWVSSSTEGAMNIIQFITTQLNWTLA